VQNNSKTIAQNYASVNHKKIKKNGTTQLLLRLHTSEYVCC
jgi:hypothetical protein